MKPDKRWLIVVLVLVVIAILLWLWNPFGGEEVPSDSDTVQQAAAPTPAPSPASPPAPAMPEVAEPVTAAVLFDFDRSALRPAEAARLDELSTQFIDGSFDRVDVVGHADRIGSDAYNLRLSSQRAAAVEGYLDSRGISAGQVRTEAKGESDSVTGNACRNMGKENRKNRKLIECLQPDRRVQITLVPTR